MTRFGRVGKIWLISMLFAGLVAACLPEPTPDPARPAGPVSAALGDVVQLKLGQTATYDSEGITITPLQVLTDSRCPSNVTCVWSGELIITVAVTRGPDPIGTFQVNSINAYRTNDPPTFDRYRLALRKATPARFYINPPSGDGRTTPIGPSDYVFDLVLTAAASEAR